MHSLGVGRLIQRPAGRSRGVLAKFTYASRGIAHTWGTQVNFRFQVLIGYLALAGGWLLRLPAWQMGGILFFTSLVLAAEVFNTAVEAVVDLVVGDEYRRLAGVAKDVAAGAVMVTAAAAFLFGLLVYPPRLSRLPLLLSTRWRENPELLVLASIVGGLLLILVLAACGKEGGAK